MSLTQCYFERLFFNDDGGAIGAVVTFHPYILRSDLHIYFVTFGMRNLFSGGRIEKYVWNMCTRL